MTDGYEPYRFVADALDAYALRLRAEAQALPLGQGIAAGLAQADRVADAARLVRDLAGLPPFDAPTDRERLVRVLQVHGFDVEVVDLPEGVSGGGAESGV